MTALAAESNVHRWTYEEWDQLARVDVFGGKRVELIDGCVVDVPPPHELRCVSIMLATNAMQAAFPASRFCIRVRSPLRVGNDSEPEPEVAVVKARCANLH